MMKWFSVLIVSFLLSQPFLLASTGEKEELFVQYKFHRLNEDQGLLNNVVIDIAQDTLGQIWVATERGLFRYQGSKFQVYLRDDSLDHSLPNNYVSDILVDNQNNIWIMTGSGVGKYDYVSDEIIRFKPDKVDGPVTSMVIDNRGNRYFGLYNGGIIRSNGDIEWLDLRDEVSGINFSNYPTLHMSILDAHLWAVVGNKGLVRKGLESGRLDYLPPEMFNEKSSINIYGMFADHRGVLWVLVEGGLYKIWEKEDTGAFVVEPVLQDILPKDDYLSLYEDGDKQIWTGTRQNGMFSFKNLEDLSKADVKHFGVSNNESGLSYRTISKIFQDDNQLFWLGTHNGGINVFDPRGEQVRHLTHKANMPSSLNFNNVWGISSSVSDDVMWVGTDGKGLNILNTKTEQIKLAEWKEIEDVAILCLKEDARKRLWVGTYQNGLFLVDLQTDQVTHFTAGGINGDLKVNDIRAIYESRDGSIFIGTNHGGAYHYNEDSKKLDWIRVTDGYDVRAITMVSGDMLWLGTYRGGLLSYHLPTGRLNEYPLSQGEIKGAVVIFDLVADQDTLWLGTREKGLVCFDMQSKEYKEGIPGLTNLAISALEMDSNGYLWMSSSIGVFAFDKTSGGIYTFDSNDGFQKGHFNYGSILYSNGFMAIGGINGLNLFYPNELTAEETTDRVVLNEFRVLDHKATPLNSEIFPKGKSIFLTDKVELSHSDNVFSIGFSIPGFNTKKQNEYTFKLEGFESEWQTTGYLNEVTYRNVPPGVYSFKVKRLRDENVSKELAIIIHPPIWRTWQAYLLYGIVFILLLWWYIRFNNSRLLLKQNLEFEQALREREHSSMQEKLRFYTNFSHELKTPLTLIQGPVNDLIKKETNEATLYYLHLIKKNTSILLKFIGRMLEFRKIEMNKTVLNVGYHDLNVLGQEEAESFTHLAKEKGVILGFYCEQDLYAWVDIEKIQIVLSNLLSNAIKFSPEGRVIKFGMFHKRDEVVVEVKDQAGGIDQKELEHIFSPFYQASNSIGSGGTGIGLALCKSFIELHHGEITVDSEQGQGTAFTVRLKKDKEHFKTSDYVRFIEVKNDEHDIEPEFEVLLEKGGVTGVNTSDKVILIVDDNVDITTYVQTLFEDKYRVIACDNARDAFDIAMESIPDLIISDLMMPDIDGMKFCHMIKENSATSHIPFIMLTAKNSNVSKIEGFESGADDYITKPFSSDLLKVRVNNLLSSRKLLQLKYTSHDLFDNSPNSSSKEMEFILNVESTIHSMMESAEFSVPDLCKELGMGQNSLYRKIKNLTGDTIQLFIRKIKIKRAAQLLVAEDMTVTEVAFAVDFSDLKYFRKCFKEQFGIAPSEYKNKFSKEMSKEDINRMLNSR
ncbi:hybrid sensor histidine kinase/response regulator transcription factor [Reichenbachiella ulvae]|uniref:histidine kinase n=1 Tax=Reichenbachiella ulvae TaxID=2980104 RepID=A0ABT3CW12_9BACT|nr:two-component regulator propeller domain-containing protein [Reichenbachiella ulvae]MCV9387895.1 ATP-binding protein [Reichenbachiella ulvae]